MTPAEQFNLQIIASIDTKFIYQLNIHYPPNRHIDVCTHTSLC